MVDISDASLYGIVDLGYVDKSKAVVMARSLLDGGVGVLQLRAKAHQPDALLPLAILLREACDEFSIPFVVNDHVNLARDCRAHGLHLGQDDGNLLAARKILEDGVLIGRSTHSVEQARSALEEGADYIGFGPLFPTPTKEGRPAIGLSNISEVQSTVGSKIPVFCIGGIKPVNLDEVIAAGARRCVVVSHLLQADSPKEEASLILSTLINQSH
jgi:thiamine-phosphate pyrophosphorylase